MNRFTCVLLQLFLLLPVLMAQQEEPVAYKSLHLENEFLMLEVLPESLGRIQQIQDKNNGHRFLRERKTKRVSLDPLFTKLVSNGIGACDEFWRSFLTHSEQAMSVEEYSETHMLLSAEYYGWKNLNLSRKISLLPGTSVIHVASSFVSNSKTAYSVPPPVWRFHLDGGNPNRADEFIPLYPIRGDIASVGGRKCTAISPPVTQISRWKCGSFAPARNWIAVGFPHQQMVFALIVPEESLFPDGNFYALYGGLDRRWFWNMHIIFNPCPVMNYGDSYAYSFQIAVFYGIGELKDICGDIAIEAGVSYQDEDAFLELALSTSRPQPAKQLELELTCNDSRTLRRTPQMLPDFNPGKAYRYKFHFTKAELEDKSWNVGGNIHEVGKFHLIQPIVHINANK